MAIAIETANKVIPIGPSWKPNPLNEIIYSLNPLGLIGPLASIVMGAPSGNGAPVLLVPGAMGTPLHPQYQRMDWWLWAIGYNPRPCKVGLNIGCLDDLTQLVIQGIDEAVAATGLQAHVFGHSLGAAIGRAAAKRRPKKVATVVSIAGTVQGAMVIPPVYGAAQRAMPKECQNGCSCWFRQSLQQDMPPDVARFALYAGNDGVMEWEGCLEEAGGESIKVRWGANHLNIVTHLESCLQIARFLATHPAKKIAIA